MNSTSKRDFTLRYSLLPLFYWGAFCSVVSYCSFYLLSLGYKNSTIGMIIAVAGIFSAVLQPIVASYADKADSISLKWIVILLNGLQIVGYILLFLFHEKAFLLSGILYGAEIGLHQISTPLINSLGTETINQGYKLNYGFSRSMGSIGYAIVAFILGRITVHSESSSVLLFSLLLLFLLELFLLLYPFRKAGVSRRSASPAVNQSVENSREPIDSDERSNDAVYSASQNRNALAFFSHYKKFTILLVGCILIYISHIMINNFVLQIVQSKGGTTAEMGNAQAIASILELPTMFLFGWMMTKASCASWFRITGLFFFIKTFATLLAPNMYVLYGVQVFQMFGWALITVSSVYYVNSIMEDQDKIKGQAYFTMTYTIGCVFGSLMGGALLESFSANAMLIAGSVCSLIGAIIIYVTA